MDTTRVIATLLRYADRHNAPASFVARLWHLRAEPHAVQVETLQRIYADMVEAHWDAVAAGH